MRLSLEDLRKQLKQEIPSSQVWYQQQKLEQFQHCALGINQDLDLLKKGLLKIENLLSKYKS